MRNLIKSGEYLPIIRPGKRVLRDIFGSDSSSAPAPDYKPMADASAEAARLGLELGNNQLAEARYQYDNNMRVARPVINAQLDAMDQNYGQAGDYYSYGRSFRPAEQAMLASAFGATGDQLATYTRMRSDAEATARAATDSRRAAADRLAGAHTQTRGNGLMQGARGASAAAVASPGGFITVNGNDYTPQELDQFLTSQMYGTSGDPRLTRVNGDVIQKAITDAGYAWEPTPHGGRGVYRTGMQPSQAVTASGAGGTTDQVRRSDGWPVGPYNRVNTVMPDYSAADAYQARTLLDAQNRILAQQQGVVDDQSRLDAADRAAISAYMGNQELTDAATRARIQSLIEANDQSIYNQNAGDIEYGVGNALADARNGYSNAVNQSVRQGMRYGFSPARLAAMAGSTAVGNASQQAAAANAARQQGILDTRGRLVTGATTGREMQQQDSNYGLQRLTNNMTMRQSDFARARGYNMQDKATQWAKQLDVIGMSRGMPGASQGAYGLATNSGNSAVANSMQPGSQLLSGMAMGAGTQMAGSGQRIQGLGGILNSQTSMYNASQAQGDGGLGSILGAGLGAWGKMGFPGLK